MCGQPVGLVTILVVASPPSGMCEDGCGVGFVCLHGLVTRWHGLYNLVANGNAQMGNGYNNVFIVIINLTCTLHCVIGLKTRG